jgi:hypothetical protein
LQNEKINSKWKRMKCKEFRKRKQCQDFRFRTLKPSTWKEDISPIKEEGRGKETMCGGRGESSEGDWTQYAKYFK